MSSVDPRAYLPTGDIGMHTTIEIYSVNINRKPHGLSGGPGGPVGPDGLSGGPGGPDGLSGGPDGPGSLSGGPGGPGSLRPARRESSRPMPGPAVSDPPAYRPVQSGHAA